MNNQDRTNLIKKITEIEGLTDAERSGLLGLLRETKTYGLVWEDKPEAIEEKLRDELPILTEVPDRAIISEDKDAPNHILIEGDNLEALSTLAYTHAGEIDVIYIDPPYNTGNKDFIYNDSYVDKEDSYRHSKWLSFMSKRLRIAKQLLSDKGVIFISIDDNEISNIRLLCESNSLFGERNFIAQLIWQKKKGGGNDSKYVATEHEYVLIYSKNNQNLESFFIPYGKEYLNRYKETDEIGRFFWDTFKRKSGKQYYPITCPDGTILQYEENGEPISWLRSEPRFKYDLANGETRIIKIKGKWTVHFKQRQPNGYKPRSIMNNVGTTSTGADTMKDIFNTTRLFDNPKPLELISFLLNFKQKNATILDFFAGSGTTLHATMQLNAEDGGSRKCILVTNNENNICEEVTYERNKRVINGYTTPKGEEIAGLKNNNLRYYRTGFVSRSRSVQNMRKLVTLATDMLCIKENLYTEQTMFGEINTHKDIFRYFENGDKKMLVIYREEAIDELVEAIYNIESENKIKVYVFSPSEDPWEGAFEEVSDKVELCALPHAIYNSYRRVLPRKRDVMVNPKDDVLYQKDDIANNGKLNFTEEGGEQ